MSVLKEAKELEATLFTNCDGKSILHNMVNPWEVCNGFYCDLYSEDAGRIARLISYVLGFPGAAETPPSKTENGVAVCPFCWGTARTFSLNGAVQATCAEDFKSCAGSDVVAPVEMWNRRGIAVKQRRD